MNLNWVIDTLFDEKTIDSISKKAWLDSKTSKKLTETALPILLWKLKKNADNPKKAKSLDKAIKKNDGSILDNLDNLDLEDGGKIIGHIFGNKVDKVKSKVWHPSILEIIAPIIMWILWKANSDTGLDAKNLLSSEWIVWKLATSFFDKDWDGDIKDDLIWMVIWKF